MRAAYLAQDRADIQFSVKELARAMSSPTVNDYARLKRLGRYLLGKPRVLMRYQKQEKCSYLDTFVDSDWAGCIKTRKSTNGGALMHGTHCLKTWSSTQSTIALSSGEAEYYGIVKGSSVLLGAISLMLDLEIEMKGRVSTDSSTGKSICSRRGLGKTRHIHTQYLWVQASLRSDDFELKNILTDDNIAALMTKYLDQKKTQTFMTRLGLEEADGRHHLAPQLLQDGIRVCTVDGVLWRRDGLSLARRRKTGRQDAPTGVKQWRKARRGTTAYPETS